MREVKTYTLSATIVGFLLIDDLTASEQNALGGWLMLIAQILQTNAVTQQNIEQKIMGVPININSKDYKNSDISIDNINLNELKRSLESIKNRLDEFERQNYN